MSRKRRPSRQTPEDHGRSPLVSGDASSHDCDILPWRFATFVRADGKREVQVEIDALSPQGAASFQWEVAYLAACAHRHEWHEPHAKHLSGPVDLYEIRFKDNHRATRALGFFGPEPGLFTITLICYHKQRVYTPRDAIRIAEQRRRQIIEGKARHLPLQVDGEDFPPAPESA
jgi:hypothetical protein